MDRNNIYYIEIAKEAIKLNDNLGLDTEEIYNFVSALPVVFNLKTKTSNSVFATIDIYGKIKCKEKKNRELKNVMIHGGLPIYRRYVKKYEDAAEIYLLYEDLEIYINRNTKNVQLYIERFNINDIRYFLKSLVFEYLYSKGCVTLRYRKNASGNTERIIGEVLSIVHVVCGCRRVAIIFV